MNIFYHNIIENTIAKMFQELISNSSAMRIWYVQFSQKQSLRFCQNAEKKEVY